VQERLQKVLAAAGVASRRKAEELIVAGRVQVNARTVTELGTKVDPAKDLVTVDGKLVSAGEERRYFLLYKPPGCVTTASDPEGRPTALEYLRDVPGRVFPVGRLDYDAEGALLVTDDGELANRLAHPRYGHRRVYLAKVKGEPNDAALARMAAGVRLEDGPACALEVAVHERAERNVWIRIVVGEGRYHLVKRLCEAVGLSIQRLFRPEFAGVTVDGLRPGQYRPLTAAEVRAMRAAVGLAAAPAAASPRPGEGAAPRSLPRAARRHGHGPPAPPERAGERPGPAARDTQQERAGTPRTERDARPARAPAERHEQGRRAGTGAGGRRKAPRGRGRDR